LSINVRHVIGWVYLSVEPVNICAQKKMLMVWLNSWAKNGRHIKFRSACPCDWR